MQTLTQAIARLEAVRTTDATAKKLLDALDSAFASRRSGPAGVTDAQGEIVLYAAHLADDARKTLTVTLPVELETKTGKCFDCAQGTLTTSGPGFSLCQEENRSFWYCLYCGSNHVEVVTPDGQTVTQGDLYPNEVQP